MRTERKGKGEGRKIQRYKNTCYSYGFTFVGCRWGFWLCEGISRTSLIFGLILILQNGKGKKTKGTIDISWSLGWYIWYIIIFSPGQCSGSGGGKQFHIVRNWMLNGFPCSDASRKWLKNEDITKWTIRQHWRLQNYIINIRSRIFNKINRESPLIST